MVKHPMPQFTQPDLLPAYPPIKTALQCSKNGHFRAIATDTSRLENPSDSIEKSCLQH